MFDIQRKEMVSTSKILNDLLNDFYQEILSTIEERIDGVEDLSLDELAEELSVTVNFSFSDLIVDYLMENYIAGSPENLEDFVDHVVSEDSPFDDELVSEDDELWKAFLSCAQKIKAN